MSGDWHVLVIVAGVAWVVWEMERLRHRAERAEWQRTLELTEEALRIACHERDVLRDQGAQRGARILSLAALDGQHTEGRRAPQRRGLS